MLKYSESTIADMASPGRPHGAKSEFARAHPFGLTAREDEVLRILAKGHSHKQCADILGLSRRTIGIFVPNIVAKFKARNTVHAVALGFAAGVLTERDLEGGRRE